MFHLESNHFLAISEELNRQNKMRTCGSLLVFGTSLLVEPSTAVLRATKVEDVQVDLEQIINSLPPIDPFNCSTSPIIYDSRSRDHPVMQQVLDQRQWMLNNDFRPNRSHGTFVKEEEEIFVKLNDGGYFVYWGQREGPDGTWSHAIMDMSLWSVDEYQKVHAVEGTFKVEPYTWDFVNPETKNFAAGDQEIVVLKGDYAIFISAWYAAYQHMLIDQLGYLVYLSKQLPKSTRIILPRVGESDMLQEMIFNIEPDLLGRIEFLRCVNHLECHNQVIEVRDGSLQVLAPKSPTGHLELYEAIRSWLWNSPRIKTIIGDDTQKKVIYYKRSHRVEDRAQVRNGRFMDIAQHQQILARIRHYLNRYNRPEKLVIFDGNLDIKEQIRLFATATTVIGPHGGGLANILMMAPPEARTQGSCEDRPKVLEFVTNSETPDVQRGITAGATFHTLYATCPWVELHQVLFIAPSDTNTTFVDLEALDQALKVMFGGSEDSFVPMKL